MLSSDVLGRLPDLLRAVAVDDGRSMSASEMPECGLRLLRVPQGRGVEVPHLGRAVNDVRPGLLSADADVVGAEDHYVIDPYPVAEVLDVMVVHLLLADVGIHATRWLPCGLGSDAVDATRIGRKVCYVGGVHEGHPS